MPQSLAKILIHAVFSTKNRGDLITSKIEGELYRYTYGIIANHSSKLITANGTSNHVHLLISLGRTMDISRLVAEIKRSTSMWIKSKGNGFENFYWQEGFGAFSIGQSQVRTVSKYIANQKSHHSKCDFKDEFRELLNRYEVDYDERYVWD